MVQARSEIGKDYGVVIVPEGLVEFVPEMNILIQEINEILSKEAEGDVETYVLSKLT